MDMSLYKEFQINLRFPKEPSIRFSDDLRKKNISQLIYKNLQKVPPANTIISQKKAEII